MTFIVEALDFSDDDAINRRMAARKEHLKYATALKESKQLLYAVALINDNKMIGSSLIYEVNSSEELEKIISDDPYTKAKVWDKITIKECRVPVIFE